MRTQPKWVVLLYLLVVFAAGSIFGAAAHRFYAAQVADADESAVPKEKSKKSRAQRYREKLIAELEKELSLRPDQVEQVESILVDIGARFKEIHKTIEPAIDEIRAERVERIMALLDPEQKIKYDQLLEERRKRKEKKKKRSED